MFLSDQTYVFLRGSKTNENFSYKNEHPKPYLDTRIL